VKSKTAKSFEEKNPRASALLATCDVSTIAIEKAANGAPIFKDCFNNYFLDSPSDPLKEAENHFHAPAGPIYILYGIGSGYHFLAAKKWLHEDSHRHLIVLEDDLRIISRFLETKIGEEFFQERRAHLFFLEGGKESDAVFEEIAWEVYPNKVEVSCLPAYFDRKKASFEKVSYEVGYAVADVESVLSEYLNWGLPFWRNFWKNLYMLPDCFWGNGLFGKFQNIPAVIIGAGPSLEKELPKFLPLRDKALFLAGGSAINGVTDFGFRPHFAGGIDPNPTQYERARASLGFQIPFFFRHRLYHDAFQQVSGPKLYLKGGDGYHVSEYYEKKLKIKGKVLGGGHSIANFLIEIATNLGCNPIILVGFDLAYTDEKAYVKGVQEEKEIIEEEIIEAKDKNGDPIKTHWKWLLEADWISEFQRKHKKVKIFNATQGGLAIKGVRQISFDEVAQKNFGHSFDLDGLVHTFLNEAGKLESSNEMTLKATKSLFLSLGRSVKLLEEMIATVNEIKQPLEENSRLFDLEQKLARESGYKYILEVFWRMRQKLDFFKIRLASFGTQKEQSDFAKKCRLETLSFLKDVALLNGHLMKRSGAKCPLK